MPKGLRRICGGGDWHFVTCSCYRRQPFLGSAKRRDLFLNILEEVRARYEFTIAGYVVMPEHFHLLITPASPAVEFRASVLEAARLPRLPEKETGIKATGQLTAG